MKSSNDPSRSSKSSTISTVKFSSRFLLVTILGLAFLTSGCTSFKQWKANGYKVGPEYHRPHADINANWLETAGLQGVVPVDNYGAWWSEFNDPVLNNLMVELGDQNLTLQAAASRIEEARAMRSATVGALFPQVQQVQGSYTRSEQSDNTMFGGMMSAVGASPFQSAWQTGMNATWELDFWGRYRRAIEASEAGLDAEIHQYDSVLVLLQAEMAMTYIQARAIEERLTLADQNLEVQRQIVDLIQKRFDGGIVSELDLRQANAEVAITESGIPLLRAARRKLLNRICVLLGTPPYRIEDRLGPGMTPVPPASIAIGVPAQLLTRRPDIRRAERMLAAQCAKIGVTESDLYPHISINGVIRLESQDFSDLFAWSSIAGNVGPGFSWDILNYGRTVNRIAVEDEKFQQLLANYRNAVLEANAEVENALTDYVHEQARLLAIEKSVNETSRAVELSMLKFEGGLTDLHRYFDMQRVLIQQQDLLVESRGKAAVALVMAYKSLGGGWRSRLQPPQQSVPQFANSRPVSPAMAGARPGPNIPQAPATYYAASRPATVGSPIPPQATPHRPVVRQAPPVIEAAPRAAYQLPTPQPQPAPPVAVHQAGYQTQASGPPSAPLPRHYAW
jgi:NodT family efflux transporter outer membrane factor (OMF) lipoprotein